MFSGSIHTHSMFSIFDSNLKVQDIVRIAKEMGANSIALTDHGNCMGYWDFMDACKKADINGVPGVEFYVEGVEGTREHLICLAKNSNGWKTIGKAITESNKNIVDGKPILIKEVLCKWFEGGEDVIATSACTSGVLASKILVNNIYFKKADKIRKRQAKKISPSDKEYLELKEKFDALDNEIKELTDQKREKKFISEKKYIARTKAAYKRDDKEELARIAEEQKESEAAMTELPILQKKIDKLRKEIKPIKEEKKKKEESIERWNEYQEKIDEILFSLVSEDEIAKNALSELKFYQKVFGKNNFYIELQNHGYEDEKIAMKHLARLAIDQRVPVVASNDIHYATKEDGMTRQYLFASHYSWRTVNATDLELYFKTDEELCEMLKEIAPEFLAREAIKNIKTILDSCHVEVEYSSHYPVFPCKEGAKTRLRNLAEAGKEKIIDWTQEYEDRYQHELSVIESLGFSDYLCIVEDFCTYARIIGKLDITTEEFKEHEFDVEYLKKLSENQVGEGIGPGRGSAAGSLICYLIGLTNLDPIKYNLLFERFLNPERVTMPDIDTDIAVDIRQQTIRYIKNRYGENAVCCIATQGTLKAKASIRAAGRAYASKLIKETKEKLSDETDELTDDETEDTDELLSVDDDSSDVAKKIKSLILDIVAKLCNVCSEESLLESDEAITSVATEWDKTHKGNHAKNIYEIAKTLEGCLGNIGVHAAGIVIADCEDISDNIPLMDSPNSSIMASQCDLNWVEPAGNLKMDLLGLRNLSIITVAEREILKNQGKRISLGDIDFSDEIISKIFAMGNTDNVFQFESDGMKQTLKSFRPKTFDDLVLLNAVYRPGPQQYIPDITAVKNGKKKPDYLLPEMEEVLGSTYGKPVFQEQIMQIFNRFAGFSLGEADIIRRYMSKKKTEAFLKYKDKFIEGFVSRGANKEKTEKFWDELVSFSEYAFNKSHAAVYSLIAYVTAHLKYFYPKEYAVGVLNYTSVDKMGKVVQSIINDKVAIDRPDVNKSKEGFSINDNKVLFGLKAIKGVANSANNIVEVRKNGPYTSLIDFVERTSADKTAVEALIKAGAFDSLYKNREPLQEAFPEISRIINRLKTIDERLEKGTKNTSKYLKEKDLLKDDLKTIIPEFKDEKAKKLEEEKEVLGYYVSEHPMDNLLYPAGLSFKYIKDLTPSNKPETIVCLVTDLRVVYRKKDKKPMAFFTAFDKTGEIPCAVFADDFEDNVITNGLFVLSGTLKSKDDNNTFVVKKSSVFTERKKEVSISVPNRDYWVDIQPKVDVYTELCGCPLRVYIEDEGTYIETNLLVSEDIESARFIP